MHKTKPLGIIGRLYLITAVLVALLVAAAILAKHRLDDVVRLARATEELRVPQLKRVADIELNVTRVSLQLRHAILARSPAEREESFQDIGRKRTLIAELVASYARDTAGTAAATHAAPLATLQEAFWKVGEANLALIRADRKEEAFAFLVEQTIPARNALLKSLADNVAFQQAALGQDIDAVQNDTTSVMRILIPLVVGATIGLLVFAWYLARTLRARVDASCTIAERVRDGDLTHPVVDARRDEFSPLWTALAGMQQALTTVVDGVRQNADGVAMASAEIAHGNADLSHRTEEQAAAIQQTATAMDQLTATVQQNATNAQQASAHATEARNVAELGGTAVGEVVATMRAISESSHRIADIIGVIDGIAFQTNILALNAAVEAARAGEQGRGFAVVASEVRTLAGRSAQAAKEIRTLIQESVGRVDQGAQMVDRAGRTMRDIVAAIQQVTTVVAEISHASAEQGSGVSQVGQAISHIDEATQQNAALVEESAAAAASLKKQAQDLVTSVAVFRTRNAAAAPQAPSIAPSARAAMLRLGTA